ncbi:MAG: hypothetical protein ACKVIH_07895 [Burkholderiales bacterium]
MSKASNATTWALACRLFGNEEPTLESALSDPERGALAALGEIRAVKQHSFDLRYVLCPYCQLLRGQVVQSATGLACLCPDCGSVAVDAVDRQAWLFEPDWLLRKLRGALNVPAQQNAVSLVSGVWRLGTYQRRPVILSRSLDLLLLQPSLIARTRSATVPWLITPKPLRDVGHDPLDGAAEWLPLEERFTLYGGNISFMEPGAAADAAVQAEAIEAVNGPFSAYFRWVHLPGESAPIGLSEAHASVFGAFWHFGGQEQEAHSVMARAGLTSDKPIDVFKVKTKNKGDPKYEGPLRAYKALVKTNQRAGTYAMPCAAKVTS